MKPQVKLRIVFLLTNDFRFDSRVRKLAQAAAEFGYESHVVCYISDATKTKSYLVENQVTIHRVGEVFLGLDKEPLWKNISWFFPYIFLYGNPKNNKFVYEKALELKPQFVWANDASTLQIGAKLKRILPAKLIYDSHEYWPDFGKVYPKLFKNWLFKFYALIYSQIIVWIEKKYIKSADIITTVNDSIVNMIKKHYKLTRLPIVITNAYPYINQLNSNKQQILKTLKLPKSTILLAYSGFLGEGRNLSHVIRTLTHLPKNYYLLLLSPQDQINKFKKKLPRNILKRIKFFPFVKYERIVSVLGGCDLGLMIYDKFGNSSAYALPNKFFEYIQSGLPVVAESSTHVVNNLISKYQIGVVTNSLDSHEFASVIQQIFSTTGRYQFLHENILKLRQKLSWQNEKKKLKKILLKLR